MATFPYEVKLYLLETCIDLDTDRKAGRYDGILAFVSLAQVDTTFRSIHLRYKQQLLLRRLYTWIKRPKLVQLLQVLATLPSAPARVDSQMETSAWRNEVRGSSKCSKPSTRPTEPAADCR